MSRPLKIAVGPAGNEEVSALLDLPPSAPRVALALAHGAGAGMNHRFLEELALALSHAGFGVLRYQFPYMEAGKKRVDSPQAAVATVSAAVKKLQSELPGIPLFAGGKSFGARMTTTAAAEGALSGVQGLINFGYPLHPPDAPGTKRAEHLSKVNVPMLFLQGDRDEFARLDLLNEVCGKLPRAKVHIVKGGDHGFGVLKRSGRKPDEVMAELVGEAARFAGI
jgi:predicted alpha/beta-hydrolase family hydrolase